jgi:hypothetical protein
MTDPHPPHSQPLAPRYVEGARAEYFAVYPDGRRCSVDKYDARRFEDEWRKEGVRVVTSIVRQALRVIGDLED